MTTLRNERGSVIVLYAVAMVAILGMAALAVDLGMLRKSRAEAQRGADAAALAGASAFQLDLDVATEIDSAITRARRVAEQNYMNGVMFDATTSGTRSGNLWTSDEVTIEVFPEELPPRVWVKARRAAVSTWFAQIFGITSLPVGATAAAVADWAAGTSCVKPIAMPDLWQDNDDDTNGNLVYDPGENWLWDPGDLYEPAHTGGDGLGTGLGSDLRNNAYNPPIIRDWGLRVIMRPNVSEGDPNQVCTGDQGNKCYVPGWWGLWGGNNPEMRLRFTSCIEDVVEVGETVEVENGWRQTLNNTIEDIYNLDPGAHWVEGVPDILEPNKTGTVQGSSYGLNSELWRQSPRVWIIAMVAPADIPAVASDHDTQFNNFMQFFFEGCIDLADPASQIGIPCTAQTALVGRFVGPAKGTSVGPNPGKMVQIIRLVE